MWNQQRKLTTKHKQTIKQTNKQGELQLPILNHHILDPFFKTTTAVVEVLEATRHFFNTFRVRAAFQRNPLAWNLEARGSRGAALGAKCLSWLQPKLSMMEVQAKLKPSNAKVDGSSAKCDTKQTQPTLPLDISRKQRKRIGNEGQNISKMLEESKSPCIQKQESEGGM